MPPKLGILAGRGELPARLIRACRDDRRDYFVIAFEGQTEPELVAGTPHAWVRLGAAGKAVTLLRENGVEEVVMAGSMNRPTFAQLMPDLWAAKVIAKAGPRAWGDDGLLRAIVRELEEGEGFRVVAPEALLPETLATEGVYGRIAPDEGARADIARGIAAARQLGALDVGQAAVVANGKVLATEDAAGTDALIARCGETAKNSRGVLVKMRKPGQEARVDLPAIGPGTVEAAAAAGLGGIAIEAGGALVIDRDGVIAAADRAGLFVIGIAVPHG
jgi:DUF1009 family protein